MDDPTLPRPVIVFMAIIFVIALMTNIIYW